MSFNLIINIQPPLHCKNFSVKLVKTKAKCIPEDDLYFWYQWETVLNEFIKILEAVSMASKESHSSTNFYDDKFLYAFKILCINVNNFFFF